MRKLSQLLFVVAFIAVLLPSCKQEEVCLRCTITIAGLVEEKPQVCDKLETINEIESEYQDIVDRENFIVGMTATLECEKFVLP